jgi:uncharacterized protein YndB with AHSA1/START domain
VSNTVKLHRVFSAPPERVFKALIDPDALVKWMAPHGFTAKVHHLNAQVGGTYKMSFRNFLQVRAMVLVELIMSWFQISYYAIPISLMIRIYRVKLK